MIGTVAFSTCSPTSRDMELSAMGVLVITERLWRLGWLWIHDVSDCLPSPKFYVYEDVTTWLYTKLQNGHLRTLSININASDLSNDEPDILTLGGLVAIESISEPPYWVSCLVNMIIGWSFKVLETVRLLPVPPLTVLSRWFGLSLMHPASVDFREEVKKLFRSRWENIIVQSQLKLCYASCQPCFCFIRSQNGQEA